MWFTERRGAAIRIYAEGEPPVLLRTVWDDAEARRIVDERNDAERAAAVGAIEAQLSPWEHVEARSAGADVLRLSRMYGDPTAGLGDPYSRLVVDARRMTAVRGLIDGMRNDIVRLLSMHRPGDPPIRGAVRTALDLLDRAQAEVVAAERGCGAENGECTDPCHAGVRSA